MWKLHPFQFAKARPLSLQTVGPYWGIGYPLQSVHTLLGEMVALTPAKVEEWKPNSLKHVHSHYRPWVRTGGLVTHYSQSTLYWENDRTYFY